MTSADLLQLVRDARPHLLRADPDTESWLGRLEERHDELSALVDDLLARGEPEGSEVCVALWNFWWQRGHMNEGRGFLERAVASDGGNRSGLLKGLGTIAFRQGDLEAADRAFTERFALVEAGDSPADVADACADLARVALRRGDFAEVRSHADRGYAAAELVDDPFAVRLPLHMRAAAARMEGRYDEARELYLRSIQLNEQLGNEVNIAGENHNLFYVALHSGDRDEAERRFRSSSDWIFANGNAYLRPYAFLDAGALALHDRDVERAAQLISCARRIFEETDSIPDPDDYVELESAAATLEELLGDRFDDAWSAGRRLTTDEAQALARS